MQDDHLTEARMNIARLEMAVDFLGKQVTSQAEAIAALSGKLDAVLSTLSEARGGWRTLMWVGGAGASGGALVAWVLEKLLHWGAR